MALYRSPQDRTQIIVSVPAVGERGIALDGGDGFGVSGTAESPGDPNESADAAPEPEATASTKKTVAAEPEQWTIALVLLAFGLLAGWGLWQNIDGVGYKALDGIAAFAVFYVIAQGIERLIEFLLPLGEWIAEKLFGKPEKNGGHPKYQTVATLRHNLQDAVAAAVNPPKPHTQGDKATREQKAADAQQRLDQKRANRSVVMFGISAALGMIAVGYFHADLLTAIGITGAFSAVGVFITGLAVSGGTKGLHDLIGSVQKAKNAKDDPKETGGTA